MMKFSNKCQVKRKAKVEVLKTYNLDTNVIKAVKKNNLQMQKEDARLKGFIIFSS